MKLEDDLALHPKQVDAGTLREAVAKAEALRVDLIAPPPTPPARIGIT